MLVNFSLVVLGASMFLNDTLWVGKHWRFRYRVQQSAMVKKILRVKNKFHILIGNKD